MVKITKLTPEQVKAYEEMTGFETTRIVESHFADDAVWDELESLLV